MTDETKTPAEVAELMSLEVGTWTLSQMNWQGLHDAVWDLYPPFQRLPKHEQEQFFAQVMVELA